MAEPPVTESVRLVVQDNPQQFVGYATDTGVTVSAEEVVLHFGLRNSAPEGPMSVNGVAKLYLSLPHAKRLANALARTLESYERTLGEIETDPNARLLQAMHEQKPATGEDGNQG